MKVIAIYNHKGGTGKTVTSVNLAYELTEKGYRVLVIDMDPQGNASSFFKQYDLNKPGTAELLTGRRVPTRCARRTAFKNLDIVPTNINLRQVYPEELIGGRETLKCACFVYSSKYDYCIIDCPPSVDFLIELVMDAADDVIVPMRPDRFSADGLRTVSDIIEDFGHGRLTVGAVFTQFTRNRDSVRTVHSILETQMIPVYGNVIRRSSAVDHSILVRRPLARCASRSTAAQDYRDFLEEYLAKEE